MMRFRVAAALLLVSPMFTPWQARAQEPLPSASRWIPSDAVIAIEISQPKPLLDLLLDPRTESAVKSLPGYAENTSTPGFERFQEAIAYLETALEVDWRAGVRTLTGGGVTMAVVPPNGVFVIVESQDEAMLRQLHQILLGFAQAEAKKRGRPDRVASRTYRDVTGWTFGQDEAHALIGSRLVISNRPESLKAVIDLQATPDGPNLATSQRYQAAKQAAGEAEGFLFADLERLKQLRPGSPAWTAEGNPFAALLAAGVPAAVGRSNWLSLGLRVQGEKLSLQVVAEGVHAGDSPEISFAWSDSKQQGAMPQLAVPQAIAAFSFYRDLHAFYAAKDELFPERTSQLIFFENMMGIFFSGRDLTEEVLAEIRPEIRFVVARQEFLPESGSPQVQLPAFAAIFRLKRPGQFAEVVEEAWQKAIGLIDITRGQRGLPGMIIDRPTYGDARYTKAYFSTAGARDKKNLDIRFNFQPCLAMLDDHVILSSTEQLTRHLLDALSKERGGSAAPTPQAHTLVEISATELASILNDNRPALVRQNMIKEANDEQEAEAEVDTIIHLVKQFGGVALSVAERAGRPEAELEINFLAP